MEKKLLASLNEREKELDKDKTTSKSRCTKLESKLQRKKEKIRQMIFDYEQKN